MSALDALFDRYSLLARQRPAFLMLFPLMVAALVLFPSLRSWWATLLTLAGGCGVAYALAEFAQSRGKRLEPRLLAAWGGLPSVAMLRHRDHRIDAVSKSRYGRWLEARVADLHLPDPAGEVADPGGADAVYDSVSRWLRGQTRDTKKFELLFKQNINYGFRRNALGLKWYGLITATIALAIGIAAAIADWEYGASNIGEIGVLCVVSVATIYFWLVVVRVNWVRIAADAYGYELLASCDRL